MTIFLRLPCDCIVLAEDLHVHDECDVVECRWCGATFAANDVIAYGAQASVFLSVPPCSLFKIGDDLFEFLGRDGGVPLMRRPGGAQFHYTEAPELLERASN